MELTNNHDFEENQFGKTLFGGSRFIFWSLGPLFILIAVGFVVTAVVSLHFVNILGACVATAIALFCLCFFLMHLNGSRFWWVGRVIAASVFCTYFAYVLFAWITHPNPFDTGSPHSQQTPWNALLGLAIIGWPCLCYTVLCRFTLKAPPPDLAALSIDTDKSADT